jgi:hypothetical protein
MINSYPDPTTFSLHKRNLIYHVVVTFDLHPDSAHSLFWGGVWERDYTKNCKMLPPPTRKVSRLRALLNRYSLPLLYITSGVMLARMAVFYYKYKTGAKVFSM